MTKTLPARPVFSLDSLAQKTWIAMVTQVAGVILTYLTQILLARWMGETEYGIYAYVLSWVMLLAIPAGLGLPLIALWVEIILTTVNVVAAPTFTVLYEAGDEAELQQVVFRIARWIFVPSLVMAIALIVFAQPVMECWS